MNLLEFARASSTPESPLLSALRKATWQQTRHGRLMSDPHTGQVLTMISQLLQPQIALELGTFSGYGTLCLLKGLQSDGVLHTVERNDELFCLQDKHWAQAKGHNRIQRHHALAMDVLVQWDMSKNGAIDLAYVDADKQGIVDQLNALLPLMSNGGWMLFDNTWWNGTLSDATGAKPDALRELNARLLSDSTLTTTVLPIGDGLSAVRVSHHEGRAKQRQVQV